MKRKEGREGGKKGRREKRKGTGRYQVSEILNLSWIPV
jgi:hypothetical protein